MHGRFSRSLTAFIPVLAATLLASCDTGSPTGPRIVSLALVSGNEQAAPVGATLAAPLVIRAVDQNGVPLPGVALVWEVTAGGGTFIATSSSTDASGLGQAVFRLGNTLGDQEVSVRAGSQPPVVFSLQATTAPASQLRVSAGNNQSGTAGSPLTGMIVVVVVDAVNNPKAGVPVTFTVASGGGSLSSSTVVSNTDGLASVSWTLGVVSGAQTVVATSPGLVAVTFTALGTAAIPATVTIVSGNNQTGSPGVTLAVPLRVRVRDGFGNGVAGITVAFTPDPGDGVISPASVVTDASGEAQANWTLGPSGGLKRARAVTTAGTLIFSAGSSVNYTNVSMGGHHACAVSTDNVLYCWGYNGEGQLGIGEGAQGSGPVYAYPQPSAATGNLTFRMTVNSIYHGCAVTLAGAGFCWGVNHDGRLGIGTLTPVSTSPIQIGLGNTLPGAHSYRLLGVSRNHTCGITFADRIFCWGYGRDGQVGNGGGYPGVDGVFSPVEVAGNLRFSEMSAGGLHTCAIALDGNTYCWGVNLKGELGDGSTSDRFAPTAIAGAQSFVRIASGGSHSCGLTAGGTAWCWGGNTFGQLGDGSVADATVPTLVAGGLTFESISAGLDHTCGVVGVPALPGAEPAGGAVYCWGRNQGGQLGDGTQSGRTLPTAVAGGVAFRSVSAGDLASCGITPGNLAYCWGDNQFGQLGDGTMTRRLSPTKVAFQP